MAKKAYGYDRLVATLDKNTPSQMTGVPPRDSDRELIIQILQHELYEAGGIELTLSADQMDIMRRFNFESLTRARRKLQEAGKFMPSPEVAKKRRLKSYEVEQTAPSETAQGLHRRIQDND